MDRGVSRTGPARSKQASIVTTVRSTDTAVSVARTRAMASASSAATSRDGAPLRRQTLVARAREHSMGSFELALPLRVLEPLRHLLVALAAARPARWGAVPTVILDRHVDAAVDEELHPLVRVVQEDEVVQDARRLVRVPI